MSIPAAIPHNREAEEATIGCVLINPEVFTDLSFLKDADFYIHRNQFIWQAFSRLNAKSCPIDLLTVSDELDAMGLLSEVGGSAYVTSLFNSVPTSLNAESYGRMVEVESSRRQLIVAANKIAAIAYNASLTADEAKELANNEITQISVASEVDVKNSFRNAMSKVYDRAANNADRIAKGLPVITGIKTGLTDLDAMLLGIENEEYVLIAGRPGQGKTSLLFDIARHNVLEAGKNVAIFSLEMSDEEVARRFISQHAKVDSTKIKTGAMDTSEWTRFNKAVEKYQNGGTIFLFDISGLTPSQLRAKCLMVKRKYSLDLVLVDYLGLMNTSGTAENRTREIGEISRKMKVLVKELKCPVIAAAQLSRNSENRTDKTPILSDLRDSGDLEQDANCVIFVHHSDTASKAIIAKRRDGATGEVPLVYIKEFTTFRNATMQKFNPNERNDYSGGE